MNNMKRTAQCCHGSKSPAHPDYTMNQMREARSYMERNRGSNTEIEFDVDVDIDIDIMPDSTISDSVMPACDHMVLAMAYVPFQQWNATYNADEALYKGTLFPELDLPFCGCINRMRGDNS